MAGIIEQNMAPAQGQAISPEAIKENTKMPPELQNAYERVVLAGMDAEPIK